MKSARLFRFAFKTFAIYIFCFSAVTSFAQEYKTGIGVRLGGLTQGLTVKHFINSNSALEGILSFGHSAFFITGLYEKQQPIQSAPGLYWFYGGGVHLGFYHNNDYYYYYKHGHRYYYGDDGGSSVIVGIDFILGMEYKFQKAPITIGIDIKPFFDFVNGFSGYWDGAFTARFAF